MHALARAIEAPQKPRHGEVTMHPEDIKAAIRKAGSSQKRIAVRLGVSETTVSNVIKGRVTSRRIANEIARITDLKLSQLWPGRYDDKK